MPELVAKRVAFSIAIAATLACNGGSDAAPPPPPPPPPPADACTADAECAAPAFCDARFGRCNTLAVTLTAPFEGAFVSCAPDVNIPVQASATATHGDVESIDLRLDGELVGRIFPATQEYPRCALLTEGEHAISVVARAAGREVESETRRFTFDRTPPALVAVHPDPAASELPDRTSVELVFDEPIRLLDTNVAGENYLVALDRVVDRSPPMRIADDGHTLVFDTPNLRELLTVFARALVLDRAGNADRFERSWSQPPLEVALEETSDAREGYVHDQLVVTAAITGGTPDRVTLRTEANPSEELELEGPPYTWTWDTRSLPDDAYLYAVRAYRGARAFEAAAGVFVDRTPPRAYFAPEGDALTVDAHPRVSFSERIDLATITPDAIRLVDGSGAAIAATLEPDTAGLSVGLVPAAPFVPPATVRVLISGIADRSGLAIAPTERTWSVPAWLPMGSFVAPPGSAFVATAAWDSETLWGAELVLEERWPDGVVIRLDHVSPDGEHLTFASDPARPVRDARGARSRGGTRVVAWRELDAGGVWRVHARSSSLSWQWLGGPLGDGAEELAVAYPARLDGGARPVVAWTEPRGVGTALAIAAWNGSWTPFPDPSGGSVNVSAPVLAPGADALVVAWRDGAAGAQAVHVSRRDADAGVWVPVGEPLEADVDSRPSLATDAGGQPAVAWVARLGTALEVRTARFTGTAWSLPRPVTAAAASAADPSITVDASGRLVVAFVEESPAGARVEVARLEDGAWARLAPLPDAAGGIAPLAGVDEWGRLRVAFTGADGAVRVWTLNQ